MKINEFFICLMCILFVLLTRRIGRVWFLDFFILAVFIVCCLSIKLNVFLSIIWFLCFVFLGKFFYKVSGFVYLLVYSVLVNGKDFEREVGFGLFKFGLCWILVFER